MNRISEEGLKLIKSFEGLSLTAYKPVSTEAYYTIGYGHYGSDVWQGMTITLEQAENLLLDDLVKYESYVNNPAYCPVTFELNQNQFDALVSFCYNCGAGNLKGLCFNIPIEQISTDLLLYNKSSGTILNGLVRRREAEKQLFDKEVETMNTDHYIARIVILEEIVKKIIVGLTQVADKLAEVPAPDWFVKEFPDALKLINQKTGTNDFWRAFALALRILQK